MRFNIWGNGSVLRPARRLNREHVESVVIGALDGSVTGPAPDRPRRRLLRLGLVVAVLAILSGGAWAGRHWWAVGRYIETTDDAYIGGNVTAIAPHVSGFVAQVLAADNEHVHTGQVLVRLDPRDFQTALDHAAAVVAARTTEVEGFRARYTLQAIHHPTVRGRSCRQGGAGNLHGAGRRALPHPGADERRFQAGSATVVHAGSGGPGRRELVGRSPRGGSPAAQSTGGADRRGTRRGGAGAVRPADGTARPRLHRDSLTHRRLCQQPRRAGWRICQAARVCGLRRSRCRPVGRRQLQGRSASPHKAGPDGDRTH